VLCPFHDDHDPSLLLNTDEDLWFCFPCGAGGDGIALVMRVRGCGFTEAVAWINARA
jgi:DNA primase